MKRDIPVTFLFAIALAHAAGFATAATPVEVPNTMAERVKPCVVCHHLEDKTGRGNYYPRIAGKPEGYLFNQLRNFRDGRRYYRPMALLLENLTDQYLQEMAVYFSTLEQPYPPPERVDLLPAKAKLAQKLVNEGDPARNIPACRSIRSSAVRRLKATSAVSGFGWKQPAASGRFSATRSNAEPAAGLGADRAACDLVREQHADGGGAPDCSRRRRAGAA